MQVWLDVTAGVAGDMLMGALVDAGADLSAVQRAIRAVAGDDVATYREAVVRAGMPATQLHVDIITRGAGRQTWPQLRDVVTRADLHPDTTANALRTLERLMSAYSVAHDVPPDEVALHEVAALDVLADVVGDCEAMRTLGVTRVTASPLALGSGRIRTSRGDLPVPMPVVALLADGWPVRNPPEPAPRPEAPTDPEPAGDRQRVPVDRYMPLGSVEGGDGRFTEGPAPVVGRHGLGELATPTGTALLRSFATSCLPDPPFQVRRIGVGAGGRDVPERPNVVRVSTS